MPKYGQASHQTVAVKGREPHAETHAAGAGIAARRYRLRRHFASAGDGPEGFAVAPNGHYAAAPLLLGTGAKHSAPTYTKNAAVELFDLSTPGKSRSVGRLPAGGLPEGIAFSPNSEYIYVGNYIDRNLQVYRIVNGHLTDTGIKLALPGQPASMRGPAR